jgi:pilus assembly protein CpaE
MSNLLHVCIYNEDPESSKTLQGHVRAQNFIRLIGEVDTPEKLARTLADTTINLVFFHLDPNPENVVAVIDEVSAAYPELAMIAISHQSDPKSIIAPMRAGCDQYVCEPIDSADLANAVSRVASRRLANDVRSQVLCVAGPSGGSGTTSIACNLALEIGNLLERDCCLVDLDLQFGDVALNFDTDPKYTIHDLAASSGQLDKTILASTVTSLPCKVSLLSRPEVYEQTEIITPEVLHEIFDLLRSRFEYTVADLPGRFDPQTIAALGQADLILVVCQLLVPSIRNAKRYFDVLHRMGLPEDRVEFIVNRSEGRSGRVTVKDLEDMVRKPVLACVPNDYQFVARSIDFGRPIAALDRNSPVRSAIRKLAQQILARTGAERGAQEGRRGFFSRILSK